MSRKISVANQKGGVGKTTTTINLGASLAALERRVLIVDLDPQGNATSGLGLPKGGERGSVYEVLLGEIDLDDIVMPTDMKHLSVAPASAELVGAELDLAELERREYRLDDAVQAVDADYDFIFFDSPPSLNLLTVNGLTAADSILIPIQCEYFALEGVSQLLDTIERVRSALNPDLEIEGIVLTMQDDRMNLSRQVTDEIREFFGEQVYDTVIPRNVRLGEAPSFGKPVIQYDIRSTGADAYLAMAREMIARRAAA